MKEREKIGRIKVKRERERDRERCPLSSKYPTASSMAFVIRQYTLHTHTFSLFLSLTNTLTHTYTISRTGLSVEYQQFHVKRSLPVPSNGTYDALRVSE